MQEAEKDSGADVVAVVPTDSTALKRQQAREPGVSGGPLEGEPEHAPDSPARFWSGADAHLQVSCDSDSGLQLSQRGSDSDSDSSNLGSAEEDDSSCGGLESSSSGREYRERESLVACVTADFAMQNVILQLGLRLISPTGQAIRQLRRWVLRCTACSRLCKVRSRLERGLGAFEERPMHPMGSVKTM